MHIGHLFRTDPLAGTAVLLCLATIFWCVRVIHKRYRGPDRFLLGLLGLIAISQGLRILKDNGIWAGPENLRHLDDLVNVTITALYLIAALLLEISSRDRITQKVHLRLLENGAAEAAPQPLPATLKPTLILDSEGHIVDCNEAAEKALGRKREEIVGSPALGSAEGAVLRLNDSGLSPIAGKGR